jgi:hypothetical protein
LSFIHRNGRWLGLGALLLTYSPLAGCSRKPAPQQLAADKTQPLAEKLCSALHRVPTERRARCCGEAPITALYDECVRHLSGALARRSVSLDESRVERCAAAVASSVASCDWVAPTLPAAPPECRGVVSGNVASAGSCYSSLECAGNLHCEGQSASKPGTCRAPAALGATCGIGVDPLATYVAERGLEREKPACQAFCSLITHRCEPEPALADPCLASANCAPGQRCVAGRCALAEHAAATRRQPGDDCRTDLDCSAGGCVSDASGRRTCQMKCRASLDALAAARSAPALALPAANSSR